MELENIIQNIYYKVRNYEDTLEKINLQDRYYLNGIGSLCILFSELERIYPDSDITIHTYLSALGEYLDSHSVSNISMFSGLTGIALSVFCASYKGKRYIKFLDRLNSVIVKQLNLNLDFLMARKILGEDDYDIMYGVCGIANYLMLVIDKQGVKEVLGKLIKYLLQLCKKKIFHGELVYGWLITNENSYFRSNRNNIFQPYVNLGLAHGIPGLLIVLINAYNLGISFPNQIEAINDLSNFLFEQKMSSQEHYYWSTEVLWKKQEYIKGQYTRDAWCYGTPGVAYSLLLAADLLNDDSIKKCAIESMFYSSYILKDVISPTFCHGYSGIAYLCHKFYLLTGQERFKRQSHIISKKILSYYNKENVFGFKNSDMINGSLRENDNIGILVGTSGILLTLISIKFGNQTPWDTAFALNITKERG